MAVLTLAQQHAASVSLALASRPNAAVVTGTLGCALIFWEFNRPGRILPAALGVLLLLFAISAFTANNVQLWAVALLLAGAAGLSLNAWHRLPSLLSAAASIAVIAGLRCLLRSDAPVQIYFSVALTCGAFLGIAATLLTRIAYRARRAKALD